MGFSRLGYRSGLPCPHPGDLLNQGIQPESFMSPALAGSFFTWEAPKWQILLNICSSEEPAIYVAFPLYLTMSLKFFFLLDPLFFLLYALSQSNIIHSHHCVLQIHVDD